MGPWRSAVSLGSTPFNIRKFLQRGVQAFNVSSPENHLHFILESLNLDWDGKEKLRVYMQVLVEPLHSPFSLLPLKCPTFWQLVYSWFKKWWFAWGMDHFYISMLYFDKSQLLQRETRHTSIRKQSIELRHELYVAFAVQARALCCIQRGKKWMSGQWKKGF